VPTHFCVARGSTLRLDENEAIEFAGFAEAVGAVERSHDFVVVDTAGTDNYLTRLPIPWPTPWSRRSMTVSWTSMS
jgi:chromosome partitioning protein